MGLLVQERAHGSGSIVSSITELFAVRLLAYTACKLLKPTRSARAGWYYLLTFLAGHMSTQTVATVEKIGETRLEFAVIFVKLMGFSMCSFRLANKFPCWI